MFDIFSKHSSCFFIPGISSYLRCHYLQVLAPDDIWLSTKCMLTFRPSPDQSISKYQKVFDRVSK